MRLAVSAMLDKGSMLASLFGVRSVDGQEVERFRAFSRHLAASDLPRAYQALEGLPEDYKRTKDWAMLRASIASYDEAAYRSSLEHLAKNFADDSSVQFMLIDHYFYQQRFDQAYKAVTAFEAHVGEDGVTNFLKCSCLLGWKRYDDAVAACQRATAVEPDFKSGYWGLITAGIESGNAKVTLAALSAYEKAFEVSFDPDVLAKTDPYRSIAGTPEFAAWARQRRSQN
jgi:predicted Zn-dependent protease